MRPRHTIAACLAALVLSACANGPQYAIQREQKVETKKPTLETKIFLSDKCKTSTRGQDTFLEIAASLLLKPLIEYSIKSLGNALVEAGKDEKAQVSAEEPTHFYEIQFGDAADKPTQTALETGCITVVHGARYQASDGSLQQVRNAVRSAFKTDKGLEIIASGRETDYLAPGVAPVTNEKQLIFGPDIRFYAEFEIAPSMDQTALQIIPLRVLTGKPFNGSDDAKRDIVTTVSFHSPGQTGLDAAFAIANMNLKKVETGRGYEESDLTGAISGWFPMAKLPPSSEARIKAHQSRISNLADLKLAEEIYVERLAAHDASSSGEPNHLDAETETALRGQLVEARKKIARLASGINDASTKTLLTSPVTIKVVLTETQKGNAFIMKLGEFLKGNASEIAEPIFNELDPTTRRETAAAELDEEDTLRIAAIEAISALRAEEAKEGNARSELAIRVAEIKARQACRKLEDAGYSDVSCLGY